MNLVEKVIKAGLCTGCGACESIAPPGSIQMHMTQAGYLRPNTKADLSRSTEAEISRVCPGVRVEHPMPPENYSPLWGPIRSCNVGHASDAEIRRMGSSGGVVSALAIRLLETGAVDFVAQITASPTDPFRNILQCSRTREDVVRAAGSRYAPSSPLASLRELLALNQRFAFVGKPCDVAALRAFLREHPEHRARIPYLLSFMCAGIPSERATHDVVKAMGGEPEKVATFRYRGDGWPGMARAVQRDGQVFEMDYNGSWGNILGKQLQFRCKICADGTGEFADVVCADAWYGKDGYPDFAERDGRSLVLARTAAGQALIADASECGVIAIEPLPVDSIAQMQPFQKTRKQLALARAVAMMLATGRFVKFRRLKLIANATGAGLLLSLRNAWGTYRRANGETIEKISLGTNTDE